MEKYIHENEETYNFEREVNNLDTKRRLLMKAPKEAYFFIPNNFQIIEENKDKPHKSLRRIFEGKNEFTKIKIFLNLICKN